MIAHVLPGMLGKEGFWDRGKEIHHWSEMADVEGESGMDSNYLLTVF